MFVLRRLLPRGLLTALSLAMCGLGPAFAGAADCRHRGLERLRAASPDGYAIYSRVEVKEPDFFGTWVQCDDAQFFLPTAVHESTHLITSEMDAFPLVGGGEIARPHEVSAFFPPSRIAREFRRDDLVRTYLRRGKATSAIDFLFLLDEFNAYTHDLQTAIDLKELKSPGQSVDHRDGLAAMMAFVAVYSEVARTRELATWTGLRQPRVADTISRLWSRAERTLAASCGIPDFGTADRYYIQRVCAAGPHSGIGEILGRAPLCPTPCLAKDSEEEQEQASAADLPASISYSH